MVMTSDHNFNDIVLVDDVLFNESDKWLFGDRLANMNGLLIPIK